MPSQTGSIDLTSQVAANNNAISVASDDATTKANNAAKTATNYITADSNGIKIHMTDNSTTYQHQSATGTNFYVNSLKRSEVGGEGLKVYVGNTAGSETEVGHFGEYTRIGDIESSHTTISPLPNAGVAMYDETGSTRALRVATSGLYIGSDDTAHFSDDGFTLFPQGSDVGDVVRLNAGSIGTQRTNITRTIKLEANETLSTLSLSGAPTISHIYRNTTELVKGTDYIQQTTTNSGGVDWEYNSTKDGHYINTNIIFNPAITGPASVIIECGVLVPQNYYMRMGPEWYNHTVIDDEGFRVINYNGDPVFNVDMASDGTSSVTVGESDKQHMVLDAAGLSAYDENGDYAEIKGIIDGENIKPNSVTANEINAENLKVSAANITGTLSADKINTNGLVVGINQVENLSSSMAWQGTCATAAGTAAKAVTCAGFTLNSGATITVRFTTANTSAAALSLNVNSTGAKTIYVAGAATAAANQLLWAANATISFTYDGTYWRVTGEPRNWYGACTIAATTAAKTAAINEVVLCKGSTVNLQMTNANAVANPTLNITSLGAKDIYTANAKLTATSSNNWFAASTIPFIFDGQNFRYDSEASSKVNNIEVGGRNLARGTAFINSTDLSYWYKNQNPILSVEDGSLKIVGNQTSSTPGAYTLISVDDGSCTVSFWYKAITSGGAILSGIGLWNNTTIVINDNCSIVITDTEWHYYSHTFEITSSQASSINRLYIFLSQNNHAVTDGIYIRHLKLEKGNKATDWTPAPEDVAADISAVNTALQTYVNTTDNTLTSLQNQVDGQIEAWYKSVDPTASNEPASTWNTDTLKQRHVGDLYYNVESGHSWRWMQSGNTYEWHQIPDSDATQALELAGSKRRIFTTTPIAPYDVGDLWVNGTSIKYATASKADGQTYSESDWTTTATDDTLAQTALNTAETVQDNLNAARTWYATCETTAATAVKVATITPETTAFELRVGVIVNVEFTVTNSAAVANLKLNVNNTGEKSIKYMYNNARNNIPAVGYLVAGIVYQFMYDGDYWTIQNMHYNSDSYDRTLHSNVLKAASENATGKSYAIVGTSLIGYIDSLSGYQTIVSGSVINIMKPLLWGTGNVAKSATFANAYEVYPSQSVRNNVANWTGTTYNLVYLFGVLNGTQLTVDTNVFTDVLPTEENGKVYIPIGILYSAYQIAFRTSSDLWAFIDGKFRQVNASTIISSHRIYYRTQTANSSLAAPTTWIEEATGNVYNQWTTKVPPLAVNATAGQTKYLYLYTCEQRKRLDGTTVCTKVLLDENTTVIDGGNIITGSVAANSINAASGTFDEANIPDLKASKITSGDISADRIKTNVISAINSLTAGQINAERIKTSELTIGIDNISDLNNIEIGGKNLLLNTPISFNKTGYLVYRIPTTVALTDFKAGDKFTIQLWGVEVDANYSGICPYWNGGGIGLAPTSIKANSDGYWKYTVTVTQTMLDRTESSGKELYIYNMVNGHANSSLEITRWKMEKGVIATDWTPAPEDIQSDMDSKADQSTVNDMSFDLYGRTANEDEGVEAIESVFEKISNASREAIEHADSIEESIKDNFTETLEDYVTNETHSSAVTELNNTIGNSISELSADVDQRYGSTKETINKISGYIRITDDPLLELGSNDANAKVAARLTNTELDFDVENAGTVAYIGTDGEGGIMGVTRANIGELNIGNNWQFQQRANGHLSLKRINLE